MRLEPSTKTEAEYPFVIFRRITNTEDNQVNLARERFEIEIIGLRTSSTKGESLLEDIREALLDEFSGTMKTWGKFDASGNADASGGLKMKSHYISTVEGFNPEMDEKVFIMIFAFTHLRP